LERNIAEMGNGGIDWIQLVEDGVQFRLLWTWSGNFRFHKRNRILDQLRNYQLFKKDSAPWS